MCLFIAIILVSDMKKPLKISLTIIGVILIIFGTLYLIYQSNSPQKDVTKNPVKTLPIQTVMTKAEAIEDMEFMLTKFKEKHPITVDELPQIVKEQYAKEIDSLSENPTVLDVWQASNRILATIHDGHTGIRNLIEMPRVLPIQFEMVDNQLICTTGEYKGGIVQQIGGVDVETLYQTFKSQFSYELESYAQYNFANKISLEPYLHYVGLDIKDDVAITIKKDGKETQNLFSLEPIKENSNLSAPTKLFDFSIDKEKSLGIFTLNQCESNDEYKQALKEFFTQVQENNIQNVAIDLRNNTGGTTQVIVDFMQYIDVKTYYIFGDVDVRRGSFIHHNKRGECNNTLDNGLRFKGKLYALTSTKTFSAAMDFATTIQDNKIGELIGDIPGNMPTCYGDILKFQLPNSKLVLMVSYKKFYRVDESKTDEPLVPIHEVKADKATDKLYELIGQKRISDEYIQ